MPPIMMGCGTSSQRHSGTVAGNNGHYDIDQPLASDTAYAGMKLKETVFDAYVRLDDSIYQLEQLCPGPRLATVEAWTEHLVQIAATPEAIALTMLSAGSNGGDDDDDIDGDLKLVTTTVISTPTPVPKETAILAVAAQADRTLDVERAAVMRLALQLSVALDAERARLNETHLAEVSVRHLQHIGRVLHADVLGHTRERADQLLELYGRLKAMYDEQDGLLATVTSGSYSSAAEEQIDQRLDSVRQVRDKLGAVAEQWRIAGNLLRTGAKEAMRASELWSLVAHSRDATERVNLMLDTMAAAQAALVAVDYAHKSLPHVDFAQLSRRRLAATRHATEYMLTDAADSARCAHTAAVLEVFCTGVDHTHRWLHDTFKRTLRANLTEAETTVRLQAGLLRAERARYMAASEVAQQIYVSQAPPAYNGIDKNGIVTR